MYRNRGTSPTPNSSRLAVQLLALTLLTLALLAGPTLGAMETAETTRGSWLAHWAEYFFGNSEGEAGSDMDPNGVSSGLPTGEGDGEAGSDMDPNGSTTQPEEGSN